MQTHPRAETSAMTNRQRIRACIDGKPLDRFPVWLKMDNPTWRTPQPQDVRTMDGPALLAAAGCDLMLGNFLRCDCSRPRVEEDCEEDPDRRVRTWSTPDGDLTAKWSKDPYTNSWHPVEYPVKSVDDLRRLRWLFEGNEYSVCSNTAAVHAACQRELEAMDAFTIAGIGPGPLMDMVEHQCGPETAIFMMADEPELFEQTLQIMHQDRMKLLRALLPHLRADTFWLTENTSTTLISPAIFREHCMPHLRDYGSLILEHGVIPVHHMCGALHALLEMIDELPALVNEAYTTRPLGDVSLAEGRTRMPAKCLLGGTNATLWMSEPEEIVATVAADLDQCPDRRKIFLTSAGVLPAGVSITKARAVTDRLKKLPAG
ncbi:MAG: uroporphyrinogen decarboxylase family protein [Phycisphaerae bacterium]